MSRIDAVDAYLKALRTSEFSATVVLGAHLSEDVVVTRGSSAVQGRDAVLERLRIVPPMATALVSVGFSTPECLTGEEIKVIGEFPPLGAAPERIELVFAFDEGDCLIRVTETVIPQQATQNGPDRALPLSVRGCIDGALANGTPMSFAYTDLEGNPRLSLRGSVHVFGDLELGMWLRPTDHSAPALLRNPHVTLLYRDSRTRTTLTILGSARIETDERIRERIFRHIPEVEQSHDPDRRGKAVVIDVDKVSGTSPRGPVQVERG